MPTIAELEREREEIVYRTEWGKENFLFDSEDLLRYRTLTEQITTLKLQILDRKKDTELDLGTSTKGVAGLKKEPAVCPHYEKTYTVNMESVEEYGIDVCGCEGKPEQIKGEG